MADHAGHARGADDLDRWAAPLSADGEARREAMLAGLLAEVPRAAAARRRRRTAARGAGLTLAAALVVWVWAPGARAPTRGPAAPSVSAIVRVATDPGVLARFAPTSGGMTVERVSDDELLRTLSAIGRPVGLVRDGDRVALTADVADPIAPAPPAL